MKSNRSIKIDLQTEKPNVIFGKNSYFNHKNLLRFRIFYISSNTRTQQALKYLYRT